jgi:hypothetical protein
MEHFGESPDFNKHKFRYHESNTEDTQEKQLRIASKSPDVFTANDTESDQSQMLFKLQQV